MALAHGAVGWSAVCDCGNPDHTHFPFDFVHFLPSLDVSMSTLIHIP